MTNLFFLWFGYFCEGSQYAINWIDNKHKKCEKSSQYFCHMFDLTIYMLRKNALTPSKHNSDSKTIATWWKVSFKFIIIPILLIRWINNSECRKSINDIFFCNEKWIKLGLLQMDQLFRLTVASDKNIFETVHPRTYNNADNSCEWPIYLYCNKLEEFLDRVHRSIMFCIQQLETGGLAFRNMESGSVISTSDSRSENNRAEQLSDKCIELAERWTLT